MTEEAPLNETRRMRRRRRRRNRGGGPPRGLYLLPHLLTTAGLALLSGSAIRVGLGERNELGDLALVVFLAVAVVAVGGAVWLMVRHGQGGALREGAADQPLADGLADDSRWIWGVLYVNRDDPSIFVEKRFGVGYTVNFGNPKAVMLLLGFLGLTGLILLLSLWPVITGATGTSAGPPVP